MSFASSLDADGVALSEELGPAGDVGPEQASGFVKRPEDLSARYRHLFAYCFCLQNTSPSAAVMRLANQARAISIRLEAGLHEQRRRPTRG
jgi:hypothetical protein